MSRPAATQITEARKRSFAQGRGGNGNRSDWSRPPDVSDVDHRFGCMFYGRYAANVNTFRAFGHRMPGTSGDAVEIQFFGAKMSQARNHPVRQRYPVVAAKMPWNVVHTPRQVATYRADGTAVWRSRPCTSPATPHL